MTESRHSINIHEAKTHFSKLVDRAAAGETVIIARAGTPIAKLTRIDAASAPAGRLGFLSGQAHIPDNFNELADDHVAELFEVGE